MIIARRKVLKSTRRVFIGSIAASLITAPTIARRKLGQIGGGGTGGGGGGYVAKAVHFDGSTSLSIAALLAGSDNGNFLASYWVKCSAADFSSSFAFWASDPEHTGAAFCAPSTSPNRFTYGFSPAGADVELNSSEISVDNWHNLLVALQTDASPSSRVLQLYLDDVPFSGPTVNTGSAFSIVFNGRSFWFGDDSFGDNFNGDVADAWVGANQFLDLSIEANRRKFISADGKPVDLGANGSTPTGTTPAVFFSGDATAFAANQGTGGAFTLNGVLTNATTSPSD